MFSELRARASELWDWLRVLETRVLGRLLLNPEKARVGIALFVTLLLIAFASQCRGSELWGEVGAAMVRGETPAIGVGLQFPDAGPKDTGYECELLLIGESRGNRNQAAAACLIVDGIKRLDIGLGVALLQNRDEYNGSTGNFTLLLRYRFSDRWALSVRHISNAGTRELNKGRDLLLFSARF